MEFKKGSKGFTLEFNEEEERNFERFVNELKKHDEYNNLSSNSDILALIINEGVATLQKKTSTKIVNYESETFSNVSDIFTTMINETFSAILQHQISTSTKEEGFPMNLDVLLNLMPDINSGNNKSVQPMEKDKYNSSIGETLTPSPEGGPEISLKKFD